MSRRTPKLDDVVEIALPNGGVAHGRVLRDASIAIYRGPSTESDLPPIGSRDYLFTVGIYDHALKKLPVVAQDPSKSPEDEWPAPYCVTDAISGRKSIYHHGEITPADPEACKGLEPAAVWDINHIIERIQARDESVS